MRLSSLEAIARALNDADVRFILVGGLAVNAHGYGRMTQDVDIVVRLDSGTIREAFEALGALGYRPSVPVTVEQFSDPAQRGIWITEKGMTVLNFHSDRHPETPIDLFASEPFDFEKEYDLALVEHVASDVPVRIVSLPTLIRLKRDAGRAQDKADIDELRLLHGDSFDG